MARARLDMFIGMEPKHPIYDMAQLGAGAPLPEAEQEKRFA
jgi:hypothetical protein